MAKSSTRASCRWPAASSRGASRALDLSLGLVASLQFLVHDAEQVGRLDEIPAPLLIKIVQGMRCDQLVFRHARGDGAGDSVTHFAQHRLVLSHVVAICDRPVAGNDLRMRAA